METVLNVLLVRFAVLALGVVLLALTTFAIVSVLRRRGRLDSARRGLAHAARAAAQHLERQGDPGPGRGGLRRAATRTALRRLGESGQSGRSDEPGRSGQSGRSGQPGRFGRFGDDRRARR